MLGRVVIKFLGIFAVIAVLTAASVPKAHADKAGGAGELLAKPVAVANTL